MMHRSQLLVVVATLFLAPGAAHAGWTGTVEVVRTGHVVMPDGPRTYVGKDSERVVYTFDGDDTAAVQADHHATQRGGPGTVDTQGAAAGEATVAVEFIEEQDGTRYWLVYLHGVQIDLSTRLSLVPVVNKSAWNTNDVEVRIQAPADTQVLAEEQVLPWRIGKLDDARRADMLVEASETVIVRLARTGD